MKICIIIPARNGRDDTLQCLESLEAAIDQREHTVLVINNGSTDGTAPAIIEFFPWVHLLTNTHNQSFAKSVNQGAEYAWRNDAEAILLLNNDTVVDKSFLDFVSDSFSNRAIGIVSPRIVYFDDPHTIWFAGGSIDLKKGKIFHKHINKMLTSETYWNIECDYATGCAMLIRKQCFLDVGGFDENFNFYAEDADFCWRAKSMGWLSTCNGISTIKHKVSASSTPFKKLRMKFAGEARLLWKHNKAIDLPRAFCGFAIFNLWRLVRKLCNYATTAERQ